VLNEFGALCRARGDLDEAQAHHQHSLAISREIGSAWDEAHALAGLARCDLARGRSDLARTGLAEALAVNRRIRG
jgi:tetratricopeptide (TPR) repeat protein